MSISERHGNAHAPEEPIPSGSMAGSSSSFVLDLETVRRLPEWGFVFEGKPRMDANKREFRPASPPQNFPSIGVHWRSFAVFFLCGLCVSAF
jgi:hypothetical protein